MFKYSIIPNLSYGQYFFFRNHWTIFFSNLSNNLFSICHKCLYSVIISKWSLKQLIGMEKIEMKKTDWKKLIEMKFSPSGFNMSSTLVSDTLELFIRPIRFWCWFRLKWMFRYVKSGIQAIQSSRIHTFHSKLWHINRHMPSSFAINSHNKPHTAHSTNHSKWKYNALKWYILLIHWKVFHLFSASLFVVLIACTYVCRWFLGLSIISVHQIKVHAMQFPLRLLVDIYVNWNT